MSSVQPILVVMLTGLGVLSFLSVVWQFLVARWFPLHQRNSRVGITPGVTFLKPLRGCDAHTRACLRSWLQQAYSGPIQILFLVQDPADPVCDCVRTLLLEFPLANARLHLFQGVSGANGKASQLAGAEVYIEHDLVLVSDADVRVSADFIAQMVIPMGDCQVGLVNCFYRLANPINNAMKWEAIATNVDFWSQVLQSRMLAPLDFALGAAFLVRRTALDEIGGFRSLTEYLADDFQLGHRIASRGHRIEIASLVVDCFELPSGWREVWLHQLRWNRTIRVCRPFPYAASIFANGTFWPLLASLAAGLTSSVSQTQFIQVTSVMVGFISLRAVMARCLAQRLAARPGFAIDSYLFILWMSPLKDLLGVLIWIAAFLGNQVVWRGLVYRVKGDGRLTRLNH